MASRKTSSVACALAAAAVIPQVQGKVTVHVVPHTHDDVGWLKTVDEYYTGQNNTIQHAYVHMILDTVIHELAMNPDRTFTYVEQAFFQRWWRQQDDKTRELTRDLVRRRQLQFTNGGWCMHDEAAPHYLDMIDQTTLGHKFLMEEFGVAPRTGWQLDPFGHSATQAALLSSEVGFQGLFFGRIDYQDLDSRRDPANKAAEFIWRASPSLGVGTQVFSGLTGEYGGNYGPPDGFDFEDRSNVETIQDDPELTNYNVPSRVNDFVADALDMANRTRGENIMFTMGSDFQWENAHEWYYNLDKIIKYVNQDGRVQALYSTPEIYIDAKIKEAQSVDWPLKTDDFFPYADGAHQFWTGYFTSRPALKRYIRDSSAFLQVVRQMATLGLGHEAPANAGVEKLAEALGVLQHHDAVSGTAKQHVTFDYAMRLAVGRSRAMPAVNEALSTLTGAKASFNYCILRNESVCESTQQAAKDADIVLWNGLAQPRTEVVELPIDAANGQVVDSKGKVVPSQVVPSPHSVTNYGPNTQGSKQTLVFQAEVPAMGYQSYRYVAKSSTKARHATVEKVGKAATDFMLENEFVSLQFCGNNLCKMTNKETGSSIKAEQSWLWYQSSTGNDVAGQKSGAYIFRPNKTEATPVFSGTPTLTLVKGDLADEVHQTFGPWVSQRIRLAKGERHAEITYTVGPIPVGDGKGKEVVSRFSTDIANNGECFVDSNGREMLPHKKDYRQSWNFTQTEPVAGNYFPITTAAFIKDSKAQLTLLTETSQAGSGCVHEGQLEMMVHRDILEDDGRGVGEPLNETEYVTPYVGDNQGQHYGPGLVIRGKHLLSLEAPASAAKHWRPLQDRLYIPVMPFFAGSQPHSASYSALTKALPTNVQLISLQTWDKETVLLRLAHQFGLGEDAELSKPATVDLGELFAGKKIVSADERGLAATISREEVVKRRVAWKVEGEVGAAASDGLAPKGSLQVTLGPLQIRTYLVKFSEGLSELFV